MSEMPTPDTAVHEPDTEHAAHPPHENDDSRTGDGASITVPLSFELATMSVPLARLQSIQQGAVLDVADGDGTLPVRILANGRLLANGTLVSIGDGYGVLVGDPVEEG